MPSKPNVTQEYNVFVSYNHADSAWVWNWLVPKLKSEGLKVCTDRDSFAIGVPSVVNMERAVESSRHTLLVLTPAWLASEWTQFEALLVQTSDPVGLRQQLIPVLREPCELPPRLSMLTYADLTDRADVDLEFAKVLKALQGTGESAVVTLQPTSRPPERQRTAPTVGIITALPKEYAAVAVLLESTREHVIDGRGGGRRYLFGEIPGSTGGTHTVVMCLADMGNNIAATRATLLLEHFPSVTQVIMTGIAGGVPRPDKADDQVRLGDIVVSNQGGVVQYDFVKETKQRKGAREAITYRNPPRPPSASLLEAVRLLEAGELRGKRPWDKFIKLACRALRVARPDETTDVLNDQDDPSGIVSHPVDGKRPKGLPRVFTGPIASSNTLLKNPEKRDALRDQFGVKAVEMEGSGIADATWNHEMGYLIVRGICDYCNPNKRDTWQAYAAVAAAAYTRALLESIPVVPTTLETATSGNKLKVRVERNIGRRIRGEAQNTASLEWAQTTAEELDRKLLDFVTVFGENCSALPVQVCSPLEIARRIEPAASEMVEDTLKRLRAGASIQLAEVAHLLEICSPRYGHTEPAILFAWAPDIAELLAERWPGNKAVIATILTPSEEDIAAVIGHEKYGHGFLYLETTLGKQVVHILADQELYRAIATGNDAAFLNAPWKRDFLEENRAWLPYLLGSVVIVEEGFAAWVQTKLLLCLGNRFASRAAYGLTRHPFSVPFRGLIPFLPYFEARGYPLLPERQFSPHKLGYDCIDDIHEQFGYSCIACILHTIRRVMDVDFGIHKETTGAIRVAMRSDRLLQYLRDGRPGFYLADQRLLVFRNLILDRSQVLEGLKKSWTCQNLPRNADPGDRACYAFLDSLVPRLSEWLGDNEE